MKTKALQTILFLVSLLSLSFSDPYSIKRISDKEYRYEFYTTDKSIKPKKDKMYYWFKGGLIHNAQYGIAGELLHNKFVKMYHSNQLAEQGYFKAGLKIGFWKTWYENGIVETTQKWKSGLKNGDFNHFDRQGSLIEKGSYKNNLQHGLWIDYIKKDTTIFKNGIIFLKKAKPTKEEKIKRKDEKAKLKAEKSNSKKISKDKKEEQSKTNKEGFFKRLFSKKDSKNKVNG